MSAGNLSGFRASEDYERKPNLSDDSSSMTNSPMTKHENVLHMQYYQDAEHLPVDGDADMAEVTAYNQMPSMYGGVADTIKTQSPDVSYDGMKYAYHGGPAQTHTSPLWRSGDAHMNGVDVRRSTFPSILQRTYS